MAGDAVAGKFSARPNLDVSFRFRDLNLKPFTYGVVFRRPMTLERSAVTSHYIRLRLTDHLAARNATDI